VCNPKKLTEQVKTVVCKGDQRKYYRFRKTKFYGGCATADCLGCNLRCVYCWGQKKVWKPNLFGAFYNPKKVSDKLMSFNQPTVRISGGEPTICREHLIDVINRIPEKKSFILETNGILLDESYIKRLTPFKNLYVRVSLKGIDEESFSKITDAKGKFFNYQLRALKLLKKYHIPHRAAILKDLFIEKEIRQLEIPNIEYESLIEYPFVVKALKRKKIPPYYTED
jgi:uncharacterized Fe-S cluster-containing radical SAM superfamily protein